MNVSIVIPTYNAARTIEGCLRACLAQSYSPVEVILVDDGSTDSTQQIVRLYPIRYIRQARAGPATARNQGWRAAEGEIICFTDADCVPAREWVAKLLDEYNSEKIAGVGGTYDIVNSDNLLAACVHEEIVQRHLGMPKNVDYLGSFNASYRRDILEQVGGFDESYRMASAEDNALAYKIVERGYKLVFTRSAVVAHHHPERLWRYLRQQFWHGYWRMKLYREHLHMSRGDVYSGRPDLMQPPLCMGTLGLVPVALFWSSLWHLIGCLILFHLILQLPNTWRIIRRRGDGKYWALAPITWLRGYARGFGMAKGIWNFWL